MFRLQIKLQLTVELVASTVTLDGGSAGVAENVFTLISCEGSPIPFWLMGTTVIVYSVCGRKSFSRLSREMLSADFSSPSSPWMVDKEEEDE